MGKKSRRIKPDKSKATMPFVARTFEGLPGEGDWIAMREFVPAGWATVTLGAASPAPGRTIRVCTLLPGGVPAVVRADGEIWIGLQVGHNFGDISRDLARAVELAVQTEPGNPVTMDDPGVGPRLQDYVDADQPFELTVEDTLDFWAADEPDEQARGALDELNEQLSPTVKLASVPNAYVATISGRTYLRWVQTHPESEVLDAFAKLHAAGEDDLGESTRLIGMFRAHGLLVPVWELFDEVTAADLEEPAAQLAARIQTRLTDGKSLSGKERSARQGLANRQLTIR